jgi:1-phosphofructokinase family hexose kinase
MIITVTLNPTVDRILVIQSLKENAVNTVSEAKVWPGGKGINVGKVVRLLGTEVTATGLMTGHDREFFETELGKLGIPSDFTFIPGKARVNIKLYDTVKGYTTDLNEKGPSADPAALADLSEKLKKLCEKSRIVIFSGSAPEGLPDDVYSTLIAIARNAGCVSILDTKGSLLKNGLKAKPNVIKPNRQELEELFGEKINATERLIDCAHEIIRMA